MLHTRMSMFGVPRHPVAAPRRVRGRDLTDITGRGRSVKGNRGDRGRVPVVLGKARC